MEIIKSDVLPRRDEIPGEMKWKLEDMYSSQEAWEKDFQWLKEQPVVLQGYKGNLCGSAGVLLSCLDTHIAVMEKAEKIFVYAYMKKDEDNANSEYQALFDRAQSLLIETESASSFIIPEILSIPDETLIGFMNSNSRFETYAHYIEDILRQRKHFLSAQEEQILAMAGEMAAAPKQIFDMLNNADMKFGNIKDETGQEIELTKGRYVQLMENRDRRVRKDAFETLYKAYEEHKNTIASILSNSVKKDLFFSKIRKYNSTIESALYADNLPVAVYENLINAVHENLEVMHRYMSLRKKALNVDELHMYDLYVPIVKEVDMNISFKQAKTMVIQALKPLGEGYAEILEEGLEGGWIDVAESRGKTGGAYCWGCYDTHPFVLLNHQDNIDSVFTLAHEMGHALHSYYSNKTQPFINAGYKIFVAEVASTLNEVLLTKYLLDTLEEPLQRAYILNHYLEQFRATVFRQVMFAEFEKIIHGMTQEGQPLTFETLSQSYKQLNIKYYGTEMMVDEAVGMEWARIPHFYSSFYVFKYATGFSAAVALAQQILQEGQPAVDRYIDFLSGGNAEYPAELLKKAGVDMTSVKPVSEALKIFGMLTDEMEKLLVS